MQTQTVKFVFSKRYLNLLVVGSNPTLSAKQMGDRLVVGRLKTQTDKFVFSINYSIPKEETRGSNPAHPAKTY